MPDPEDMTPEDEMDAGEADGNSVTGDGDDSESDSALTDVPPEGSSMADMVAYIARALASEPDAVRVTEEEEGGRTVLHLLVDDVDKGKVIGRDGRVAQAIRSLLRVAATKAGTRVMLEID